MAQVTRQWFDWINEEFKNQIMRWNDIVPNTYNCYLPTIGGLKIEIEGYLDTTGIESPQFTIDVGKTLELLQGKDFYNNHYDSIRELIQNAVDATLLRFFLEAEEKGEIPQTMDNSFFELAKKYPIDISITPVHGKEGFLTVSIRDRGIGISRENLKFLSNTGSSSRNIAKRSIIERMPEWMRPSGVFGIGFQSIFLLTDKVTVKTKDFYNDEKLQIEMYNPNSDYNGVIYLRPIAERIEVGTEITFEIKEEKKFRNIEDYSIEDLFSSIYKKDKDIFSSRFKYRSPFMEEIKNYARLSFFPIRVKGSPTLPNYDRNKPFNDKKNDYIRYFDPQKNLELFINKNVCNDFRIIERTIFYRNAKVRNHLNIIIRDFLDFKINIHSHSANEVLSLDREKLKGSYEKELDSKLLNSLVNFINSDKYHDFFVKQKDTETTNNSDTLKERISALMYYFGLEDKIEEPDKRLTDIKDITLFDEKQEDSIRFREFLSLDQLDLIITIYDDNETQQINIFKYDKANQTLFLGMERFISSYTNSMIQLFLNRFNRHFNYCYLLQYKNLENNVEKFNFCFRNNFSTDLPFQISIETIIKRLNNGFEERQFIPYLPEFEQLRIPTHSETSTTENIRYLMYDPNQIEYERILSPFIRKDGIFYDCRTTKFYEFVKKYGAHPELTIEEIKAEYDRLVEEFRTAGLEFQTWIEPEDDEEMKVNGS